jgi:hypothetical protein
MYAGMIAKMARMALIAPRRFFLAQTGELNIFNKQQANHRNTQPLVILSIQIFSTAQYSIGFRNT